MCVHAPGNKLGAAGAEALAPALKEMKTLQKLNLGSKLVIAWGVIGEGVQAYTDTTPFGIGVVGGVVGVCVYVRASEFSFLFFLFLALLYASDGGVGMLGHPR